MLHIIQKSALLERVLSLANEGDAILLIEESVRALARLNTQDFLAMLPENCGVYALGEDLAAHGMLQEISRYWLDIKIIDYSAFVDIATRHPASQTWY